MPITFVPLLFAGLLLTAPLEGADIVETRHLPASIEVESDLRADFDALMQRSFTFRRQCQRIDAAHAHVYIRRDPQIVDRQYRARSVITRSGHTVVASVAITPFGEPGEWLAHELEHVLEQIEGVGLPALARRPNAGVWTSGFDAFETERAIRAGRIVRRELQQSRASARTKTVDILRGDD
jgi:hypothetical protein